MNISIVIPNYNGKELLPENIPHVVKALLSYKAEKRELIIVDDGSKDTSVAILKDLQKKYSEKDFIFTVLENSKNRGFSPTVNRGVAEATGEIVILLNSDVRPYEDFLAPLLAHFTREDVFGVGCADESIENGKTVIRGRGIGSWKRGILVHGKGSNDKQNTLWVSGGSSAFRRDVWDTLGGLDTLFAPFYWEDIDLSYRAQKMGYRVLFEKDSRVIHEHEKGSIKTEFKEKKIKTVSYRNQFIFAWKNMSDTSLILKHLLWLPIHLLSALKRRDKEFLVGFTHALLRIGKVLQERRRTQKLVTKSDADVVDQFKAVEI